LNFILSLECYEWVHRVQSLNWLYLMFLVRTS
jgi:hypothetical protein